MKMNPALIHLRNSILQGGLAGVLLAELYTTLIIPLTGLLIVVTNIPGGKAFEALIGAGAFAICAWPFAILLGILPGGLLGLFSGLLVGLVLLPFRRHGLGRLTATILGAGVGLALVIGLHLLVGREIFDPVQGSFFPYFPYLFWVVGPGLLLVLGLGWVGWRLSKSA